MQRRILLLAGLGSLAGCGSAPNPGAGLMGGGAAAGGMGGLGGLMGGMDTGNINDMMAKQKLNMDMMSSPDLPAWHAQREKMALAIGDRSFQRPFARVFDSLTVAFASLGSRVQNMERVRATSPARSRSWSPRAPPQCRKPACASTPLPRAIRRRFSRRRIRAACWTWTSAA